MTIRYYIHRSTDPEPFAATTGYVEAVRISEGLSSVYVGNVYIITTNGGDLVGSSLNGRYEMVTFHEPESE